MLVQSLFFAHDEMGFDTTLCHGLFGPALWPLMACYSNWLVHVGMEVSNTAKVHNMKQGYKFS